MEFLSLPMNQWELESRVASFLDNDSTYLKERAEEIKRNFVGDMEELKRHLESIRGEAGSERQRLVSKRPSWTEVTESDLLGNLDLKVSKVFRSRESELTSMLQVDDYKAIYHIFLSVFILYGMCLLIEDLFDANQILKFEMISAGFAKGPQTFWIWSCLVGISLLLFPLCSIWRGKYISDTVYIVGYCALQLTLITLGGPATRYYEFHPASSIVIICEQVRLSLKMHSFMREIWSVHHYSRWVRGQDDTKLQKDKSLAMGENFFEQYLYFLIAPTLIYRHDYPRTPKIRWSFALYGVSEFFGCVFFTNIIFVHYFAPTLNLDKFDFILLMDSIFSAALPGMTIFFLVFFMVFHSWMNVAAELLRFADRNFYQDWWNANSWSPFQRKFATFLYDWMHTYLFSDFIALGFPKSVAILFSFAFVVSVVEYIASFSFMMFFPLISFIAYLSFFVWIVLPVTNEYNQLLNTLLWIALLLANGALLSLYSRELYVRTTPALLSTVNQASWVPYSVQLMMKQ